MSIITPEQQKLAEENHRLIYEFIKIHQLDKEEYYDLLAISLCKAAIHYNKEYAFSTYAFKIMLNDLRMTYRNKIATKRVPDYMIKSFSDSIEYGSKDETFEYETTIKSWHNTENEALLKVSIEEYMKTIPLRDRKVLIMRMNGYDYQYIADQIGISRALVNRIVNRLKKHLTS